jgi:alanine-alpha-ketoisovalerate/valine-pyruvate aminotransferase
MELVRTLNENPRVQEFRRTPPPQMPQMQNYNQMLQQGMRRNQDMNQAVQNLAAPTGPARSFSQVVGGVNRMNRMPRQPRNNFLAPSNQKLI